MYDSKCLNVADFYIKIKNTIKNTSEIRKLNVYMPYRVSDSGV